MLTILHNFLVLSSALRVLVYLAHSLLLVVGVLVRVAQETQLVQLRSREGHPIALVGAVDQRE